MTKPTPDTYPQHYRGIDRIDTRGLDGDGKLPSKEKPQ